MLIYRFALQLAGPMWSGPIHDSSFASEVLKHVEEDPSRYGTSTRMRGMLTVASEVRLCSPPVAWNDLQLFPWFDVMSYYRNSTRRSTLHRRGSQVSTIATHLP